VVEIVTRKSIQLRQPYRLPDDKHFRLRKLAKHRPMGINELMEELATISIAEFDTETRFRSLAILEKLDAAFAKSQSECRRCGVVHCCS